MRLASRLFQQEWILTNAMKMHVYSHGILFVLSSLRAPALCVEMVEYLDRREALEVVVRRLEPEDEAPEEDGIAGCLVSRLGSL